MVLCINVLLHQIDRCHKQTGDASVSFQNTEHFHCIRVLPYLPTRFSDPKHM